MPESGTRRKRQRTDCDAQHTDGPPVDPPTKCDQEFWFEDGNIVLVARDVQFRVYKGILAKHSPVFKDMFSLPPPPASPKSQGVSATVETCPLVHLSDSPEDIRHVLRVCMPDTDLSFGSFSTKKPSFDMISAIIRIGHKYQMQDIVTRAVGYLKTYFPTRLEDMPTGATVSRPFLPYHPIGVVNLARLVDEPSILPLALLGCCALSGADVIKGFRREDGTREQLALDDIGRCIDGCAALISQLLMLSSNIFSLDVSGQCEDPRECREMLAKMLAGVGASDTVGDFADLDSVFDSWLYPYEGSFLPVCCKPCQDMLRRRDLAERRKLWKKLPVIMGVEVDTWS